MTFKLFTQPKCVNCVVLKNDIKKAGISIGFEEIDTSTVDGFAEARYYEVNSTPTVVIEDRDYNAMVVVLRTMDDIYNYFGLEK